MSKKELVTRRKTYVGKDLTCLLVITSFEFYLTIGTSTVIKHLFGTVSTGLSYLLFTLFLSSTLWKWKRKKISPFGKFVYML